MKLRLLSAEPRFHPAIYGAVRALIDAAYARGVELGRWANANDGLLFDSTGGPRLSSA